MSGVISDCLGLLFLYSGFSKLRTAARFAEQVASFGILPAGLSRGVGYVLPPLEAATGLALLVPFARMPGLLSAAMLLSVFTAFVAWAVNSRRSLSCFCFGEAGDGAVSGLTLARNGILAGLSYLALGLTWFGTNHTRSALDHALGAIHALSALFIFLAAFELASLRIGERRMVS